MSADDPRIEAARLLEVEIANIHDALSMKKDGKRVWRALSPDETGEIADRLLAAIGRYAHADPRPPRAA